MLQLANIMGGNPIFMFHEMLKNFKRPGKLKKSSQRKTTLQQEAHP
jgi:hypothetical protein